MVSAAILGLFAQMAGQAAAPDCSALRAYAGNDVTVLEAEAKDEVCRVRGVVTPVEGSRVGFLLFLPQPEAWNGRLKMLGNGGYSSSMSVDGLEALAAAGYVAVATDTGHAGDDPDFVVGDPEALTDWAWRAVHVTAEAAKGLAAAHYARGPDYSYFEGCSTGGQQALSEVQRFPGDFDGVIAGAPGHNRIRLNAAFLNQFLVNRDADHPETPVLIPQSLRLLGRASLEVCDTDPSTPYIDDPLACEFDPDVLACERGEAPGETCLSDRQIEVARAMYDGTRNPETGELIYPGWLVGSEAGGPVPEQLPGWSLYWADPQRGNVPARQSFWRFWVFDDPSWTWQRADLATDVDYALANLGETVDATEPDISAFAESGGKLLHFHGLSDPVVSPLDSIAYHASVEAELSEDVSDFYRLFLLPGVEHCRGGPGPSTFDGQAMIEAWVEQGIAPDTLTARYDDPAAGAPTYNTPYKTNNGD